MICDEIPTACCAPEMIKRSCLGAEDEGIQISVPEVNISSCVFWESPRQSPSQCAGKKWRVRKKF